MTTGTTGDPSLPPRLASGLVIRVLSALVMMPVALAATWYGGYAFALLVTLASAVMAWEWSRLVGHAHSTVAALPAAAAAGLAVLVAGAVWPLLGVAVAVAAIAIGWRWGRLGDLPWLAIAGFLWVTVAPIGLIWLRADPALGRITVLWLLVLVWAIDTGAYAAGRTLGGPRLVPRISPNKTWAGLGGGILAALAVGLVTALLFGGAGWLAFLGLSALLALIEQAGDLAESAVKRRFGAKDSSHLIPGHGGMLDRLDGMLAVVAVVVFLTLVTGRSVLTWQ